MNVARELRSFLPADAVVDDPGALAAVAGDQTEIPPGAADVLVRLSDRRHVPPLLRFATEHRIPVTPRVAGTNLGGLAIPERGGIVLDLSPMERIVEVDVEGAVARIEPGVTWQRLHDWLEERRVPLRIGYPLSPPDSSVLANLLLDGLGNLSMRHGPMGQWITSLEAVLPTGEVVRAGSAALVDAWFSRAPLPDLTGLFLNWQGTTGVVVEAGVELWPLRPHRHRAFVLVHDRATAFRAMRELALRDDVDDVGGLGWPTARLLFDVHHPAERDPAEPEFFLYLDLSADTERELALRRALLEERLERLGAGVEPPLTVEDLLAVEPAFRRLADFPTRLDFLLDHPDGGLTWVGTYGPMAALEAASDEVVRIMEEAGRPPMLVVRPMRGGHFGVLRTITVFRADDPEDRRAVAELNRRLLEAKLAHGFVPYKMPVWAQRAVRERLHPGTRRLIRRLRRLLDPADIMNPPRWRLGGEE